MKQYVLTQEDIDKLRLSISLDPELCEGGSTRKHFTEEDRSACAEAHRYYNYQICQWISEVTK